MLSADMHKMVTENLDLVDIVVNTMLGKYHRRVTEDQRHDLHGEVSRALVEVGVRWPTYCAERDYDPTSVEFFRIFATQRLKGAVIDLWRKESPLTRKELDYSTYAMKHGVEEAAKKYDTTVEKVQEALDRREVLLKPAEMPEDHELTHQEQTTRLGDVLDRQIDGLPLLAKAWMTLTYVDHLSTQEVRSVLEIPDHVAAHRLQGFVEYHLITPMLSDEVREKALLELFGSDPCPVLEHAPDLPHEFVEYTIQQGSMPLPYIASALREFSQDERYFDEVIQSAMSSRAYRLRMATRKAATARRA